MSKLLPSLAMVAAILSCSATGNDNSIWKVDSGEEWKSPGSKSEGIKFEDGFASPTGDDGQYQSVLRSFPEKRTLSSLTITQSPVWQNWTAVPSVTPINLRDAPVFLVRGPEDYWIFGRYGKSDAKNFQPEKATLEGFDIPLQTTPFPKQYDAPGGLKEGLGGYHAWQSRDMEHWVHHGPVTDKRACWVTTAELVDGKTYIYYDFPNDQDPHVIIDDDLTDGIPGQDQGMAFADPSDGSDCTIIRDQSGQFHLVYEDWSPINAKKHSWDSPLAGHAVSPDGIKDFKILPPAVDKRTRPTGKFAEFDHPHWHRDDPKNFPGKEIGNGNIRAFSKYEIHEPEQDAFGDWAAIAIGDQYYLFGDFHPAKTTERQQMQIAWFTSPALGTPFEFCGSIGSGHPDPDIGFAEGQFYLINQTKNDYVSPGPWVDTVEVRVGIDTTNNGQADTWSDWQAVREKYDYLEGFAKQLQRTPASMDLKGLPAGFGFCFELRLSDATENESKPILDSVILRFE